MTVRAPFRFAPISRQVHFPKWGPLVSHDVPFKDGLSGEVTIEMEATQPLLVGGARRKATELREGEVWPFAAADGSYVIPDSTVQGMLRSIIEVAALGRLGNFVNVRRFGFRDLHSRTGRKFYQERMATKAGGVVTQHAKAGWLVKDPLVTQGNPNLKIIPCEYARITFGELGVLKAAGGVATLELPTAAPARYNWFIGGTVPTTALNRTVHIGPLTPYSHADPVVQIYYQRAFARPAAGRVATPGTVVFTGKTQRGVGPRAKKLEFVLHTPDRANAPRSPASLPVDKDVWRDFDLIHSASPGRDENPNWTYWKAEFETGQPVPVFYLLEGGQVTTFGTAFMFKTALELSTHDMLANSTPDHIAEPDDRRMDLPSLIFGAVSDDFGDKGLKRRASFDLAQVTVLPTPELHTVPRAILLDPKASYFPSYVRQPGDRATGKLDDKGKPFATYAVDPQAPANTAPERTNPELAGTKVWPARNRLSTQVAPPHLANQHSIQVTLNALPCGTTFKTTLRFHNLRPAELGAVLWALSFGAEEAWTSGAAVQLRHRLGMGKPYGLGEIAIRILADTLILEQNDSTIPAPPIADMIGVFAREMGDAVAGWRNLPQMRTLLAAANPRIGSAMPSDALEYMTLNPGTRDDFTIAKTNGTFLSGYMTDEVVIEARVGARIRMVAGARTEGVIFATHPNPPEWSVLMDGSPRPVRYVRQRFEVIG